MRLLNELCLAEILAGNCFNYQNNSGTPGGLIHEIMYCVLLDIYTRAHRGDKTACDNILSFGVNKNDCSNFFTNEFA